MTSCAESAGRAEGQGAGSAQLEGSRINLFLTRAESRALHGLQMGEAPRPHCGHAIWDELSELWLVRIEGSGRILTLTEWGRAYPT